MNSKTTYLVDVAWVPGLPHLLDNKNGWGSATKSLSEAVTNLGADWQELGVKRIVYFSTQWISVLGQMIQTRPTLRGRHVDENWHMFDAMPFDFEVDSKFGELMAEKFLHQKFQTKLVDFEGFPVDTGTIVADTLINKACVPVSMVACHVYSDFNATEMLASLVRKSIEESKVPTAVVCVTGMSGRFFTHELNSDQNSFRQDSDRVWDGRMLELIETGDLNKASAVVAEYASATKADMGLKALAWTQGLIGSEKSHPKVLAYAPIYGSGAVVLSFGRKTIRSES
jgi:2-aminophenol/2-amino-5-chlorophenol 1,6-dioxygenase alpha subunit